jgi:3-dehydroquinate dehydratase-2
VRSQFVAIFFNTVANGRQILLIRADLSPPEEERKIVVKVRVFNGPNLNLLGQREPGQYGKQSLQDIMRQLGQFADTCGIELDHFQTNSEGAMVDAIQKAGSDGVSYIIINPAGYTHTSVAIRDALLAVDIPFVEVHLSAVSSREPFRQISYFSDVAIGVISGFRGESYLLALQAILNRIEP